MKIAFFHGLESKPGSGKEKFLQSSGDAYTPAMNYKSNFSFQNLLKEVKKRKIDLLVGSSMGGWTAYALSTHTGIPTILFNPAVQGRAFDPDINLGSKSAKHTVVLGKTDDVIDPKKTEEWIKKNGKGSFSINYENIGHRTPINVFKKWLSPKMNESFGRVMLFEQFMSNLNEAEDRTAEPDEEVWKSWKELVNMTPAQIKQFRDGAGKDAGLTQKEAEKAGDIDTGKESAEMLIKMIPSGKTFEAAKKNWTPSMWFWAGKQVSFNSRMIGAKKNMKAPYFYRNGEMTRWLKSLLIWGHIPDGYTFGKKPEEKGNL